MIKNSFSCCFIISRTEKIVSAYCYYEKKKMNVKKNIVIITIGKTLNNSKSFLFTNIHTVNLDLNSPSRGHCLLTSLSHSYINIRLHHYAEEIN